MKGWFWIFLLLQVVCFLIKLAKNHLAYSKNDGHEEKRDLLLNVKMKTGFCFSSSGKTICLLLFPCTQLPVPLGHAEGWGEERRRGEEERGCGRDREEGRRGEDRRGEEGESGREREEGRRG